jgi:hypothetical protein
MALPIDIRRRLSAHNVDDLLGIWDTQADVYATTAPGTPAHDGAELLLLLLGFELGLRGSDYRHCDTCGGPHGHHLPTRRCANRND